MPPAFRSIGTPANSIVAITPGLPAGMQANDVMLLCIESSGTPDANNPLGWTDVAGSSLSAGTTQPSNLEIKWRRVVDPALETAPTVADRGDHTYGVILAYSGVTTIGNPYDVTGTLTYPDSSEVVLLGPALTTTVGDTLVVEVRGDSRDVSGGRWTTTMSNPNLTDLTERLDGGTGDGNGGGLGIIDGVKTAAGNTGQTSWQYGTTVVTTKNILTIALQPPTGGAVTFAITASGSNDQEGEAVLHFGLSIRTSGSNAQDGSAAVVTRGQVSSIGSNAQSGEAVVTLLALFTAQGTNNQTGNAALAVPALPVTYLIAGSATNNQLGSASMGRVELFSVLGSNAQSGTAFFETVGELVRALVVAFIFARTQTSSAIFPRTSVSTEVS